MSALAGRVSDGVRAWRVFAAGPPDSVNVWTDGVTATVEVRTSGAAARPRRATQHEAAAPMPARVLTIAVTAGQNVLAGDVLLTLEAMKMELPVRAPRTGVVTALHCAEGDLVQPGVPLVDIA